MVEAHGWITLRETYKAVEDDNVEALLKQINDEIKKIEYPRIQIKVNNGNYYIEFSVYTNHMSGDINDLIVFLGTVGKIAEGSYGLLYIRNDEDNRNYNSFTVYRLARGKVQVLQDAMLSPVVPILEDEDDLL
ncbi:MAG: immunity 7 family protein [Ruminococcus flavefaciens]|nr:immunity 7 family protein [Ruminococcus flavefaciens]